MKQNIIGLLLGNKTLYDRYHGVFFPINYMDFHVISTFKSSNAKFLGEKSKKKCVCVCVYICINIYTEK